MAASINASTSAGVVTTADTTGNLNLQSNGTTVLAMTSAGIVVTGTLVPSGKITATTAGIDVPTSALGTCYSGTYTPTLSAGSNVAASTMYVTQYSRVGNYVQVAGRIDLDPTIAGDTSFQLSLPIASDFTSVIQCCGVLFANTSGAGSIQAEATNNTASFSFVAIGVANQGVNYTYGYLVV